jgi:hypothetical protein
MPQLTNLDVEWVSLVNRAAVRDPVKQTEPMRFLVWKRDTSTPSEGDEMKITDELLKQLGEPVEKEADLTALVEKAEKSEEVGKALQGAARLLAAHKADLPEGALAEVVKAAGLELPEPAKGPEPTTASELVESLKKSDIDAEIVSEVEKALADASKKEAIDKADLPQPVRDALAKAEADRAEDRKRVEKAENLAKEERDARLTKEFVAKAEGFKGLPTKAEEFGPVLKAANEKLTKDESAALETVLKAANEAIEKGELFKEQGVNGAAAKSGALEEATRKAEELRKSDSKLSETEALDQVLKSDRALQERYLAEMQGR